MTATTNEQTSKTIGVAEIFGPTIQGEGNVIGMPTMFLRTVGCDFKCGRCDSLHAVLPELFGPKVEHLTPLEIADQIDTISGHCRMVTLSGGNPCIWPNIGMLIDILHDRGFTVALETQGTIWQDWVYKCDYITISPKGPGMDAEFDINVFGTFIDAVFSNPNQHFHQELAIKVVCFDRRDLEFASDIVQNFGVLDMLMYLSVGNMFPPAPATRNEPSDEMKVSGPHGSSAYQAAMNDGLLESYRILIEEAQDMPLLRYARILPQMHVLLWGNKQGV